MPAHARYHRVLDEIHRIGSARIFGEAVVIVIGNTGGIQHQIFQHRAEADGAPDLRLIHVRQLDALGITAAFEIENSTVAPAMLVVADQPALRIGGKRGLASAGEAEKQRRDAICPDVGRAVHGKNAALGQQKIHHAKNGFLHLSGIMRAADEHQPPAEVDQYEYFGFGSIALRIGQKCRRGDHREFRRVSLQLLFRRTNEEIAHKQVVPGKFVDHSNGKAVLRVGASEQILHVKIAGLQIFQHPAVQGFEFLRIEGLIYLAPKDFIRGDRVFDGELVFGGAAGALACPAHQRAVGGKPRALAAPQRVLHQHGRMQIAIHIRPADELIQGYDIGIAGRRLRGHEAFSSKDRSPAPMTRAKI